MDDSTKDVLALLTQLMPGFLTAWVVFGLTTYTKPPQFERVVEALIYSFIVNALVALVELVAIQFGKWHQFGVWDKSTELIASSLIAIFLGLLLSYCMRSDSFFRIARSLKLTSRTPFPSEWYGAFAVEPRFVVLHLSDGRRISGYPREWPTDPKVGHFRLTVAAWIEEDNSEIPLDGDDSILIEAKMVEMVELLKNESEKQNGPKVPESTAS